MEEIEQVETAKVEEQPSKETKQLQPPVEKANLVKRVIAGIIDLFVAVFIFLMMQSFVVFPIAKACAPQYNQNYQTFVAYYQDAGLGKINEKDGKIEKISEEDYISASENYYNVYCASGNEGSHACKVFGKTFKEVITEDENIKEEYYSFDANDKLVISDSYKDNADFVKQFNSYVYSKALTNLQTSDVFKEPFKYVTTVQDIAFAISVVIGLSVTYLLIPILNSKGQTLGKMTFKLALTNQQGFKVKKSQIVVRFLAFSVINILLGFITVMIVPLISFTIMVLGKKNAALHDYCAVTMVVDDKASVIYKNREEFEKSVEEENDRFSAIEKRREEYYSEQNNQKK